MARPPFFASLPSGSRSRNWTDSAPHHLLLSRHSVPSARLRPFLKDPVQFVPNASLSEPIALMEDLRREFDELRARVHRLERENLELRQQAGYWKSSPSRCPATASPRWSRRSNNSKAKNANSKPISSDDAPKPDLGTIAPMTWMIPKTTPRNLKRNRGQQPGNPGPKRRDYSHLPVREKFSNCLPSNVSVLAVACLCCAQRHGRLGANRDRGVVPTAG